MWRRSDALAFALIVVACKRDAPPAAVDGATAEGPEASAPIVDAATERFTDVDELLEIASDMQQRMVGIEPEHLAHVKSIGHTSVVLKLEMREGHKYVFKPRSKKGHARYNGEIAAFRLGLMLGIGDNLPKAYPETFARTQLLATADENAAKVIAAEVVFEGEVVHGAKMPWIDDYAVVPLENDKTWRAWLKKDGTIPDDQRDRAREISTMILFDFVTGNWDRWSGGNIATSQGRLLYVDNDGAFFETPPKDGLARNKRYLEGVDRFSRAVVEKLRAMTREELRSSMRDTLSDKALDGVLARRDEALAIVDTKELFFP